jgi:hypothetical protein
MSLSHLELSAIRRLLLRFLAFHEDSDERVQAVEMLGELGDSSDLTCLERCCSDDVSTVRCAAVSSLAMLGGHSVLQKVKRVFKDSDPIVRRYAYVAAKDTGNPYAGLA